MLPIATTAARNAVHRHAPAMSTRFATDQIDAGLRWSRSGWPDTSEMVSGTSSAALTAHAPAASVPVRSARYPAASSTPVCWGGTKNAANRNEPTATTAAISPAARTNGKPIVVTGPGSGSPVAVSASASDSAAKPAAVQPASRATPRSNGHTVVRRADTGAITRPAYCPSLGLPASGPARGGLTLDELLSRHHVQPVRVAEDATQFTQKCLTAFAEVRSGFQ